MGVVAGTQLTLLGGWAVRLADCGRSCLLLAVWLGFWSHKDSQLHWTEDAGPGSFRNYLPLSLHPWNSDALWGTRSTAGAGEPGVKGISWSLLRTLGPASGRIQKAQVREDCFVNHTTLFHGSDDYHGYF